MSHVSRHTRLTFHVSRHTHLTFHLTHVSRLTLQDETAQINGYVIIVDLAGFNINNFRFLRRRESRLRAHILTVLTSGPTLPVMTCPGNASKTGLRHDAPRITCIWAFHVMGETT